MPSCTFSLMSGVLLRAAALLVLTSQAGWAGETDARLSLRLRVGETRQVVVFGGHTEDCSTSTSPLQVSVFQPPRLGMVSQRENVPYQAHHSISGTCLGGQFVGTAVDYTASTPGADSMVVEATYANGTSRRIVSIVNR